MQGKYRKWFLLILPMLVLSLALAACAGDTTNGTEEPGVVEPGGLDEGLEEEGEALGEEAEEPLAPEDDSLAEDEMVTEEPTVEATEEVTEEAAEPTPEAEEGVQFVPATTQWVSSDRLMDMTIYTQDGVEIGAVSDVLMDEQGSIRYVIFDAGNVLSDDAEFTTVAADWTQFQVNALDTDDGATDLGEEGGLAGQDDDEVGPGDPPEGQTGDQGDEEDDADVEATPAEGDDGEVGPGNPPEGGDDAGDDDAAGDDATATGAEADAPAAEQAFQDQEELVLVYAGDAAQLETMTFDEAVLDESGLFVDEAALTAGANEAEMAETPAEGDDAAGDDAEATPSPEDEATEDMAAVPEGQRLIQATEVGDFGLVNQEDESLGNISSVLVDLQQGLAPYALADIGGFLGIGANTIAIPWDRLTLDAEQEQFVLNATQEQLEQAPIVDVDAIETEGFANQPDIDTFWQGLDAGGTDTGGAGGEDAGDDGS